MMCDVLAGTSSWFSENFSCKYARFFQEHFKLKHDLPFCYFEQIGGKLKQNCLIELKNKGVEQEAVEIIERTDELLKKLEERIPSKKQHKYDQVSILKKVFYKKLKNFKDYALKAILDYHLYKLRPATKAQQM